jgi:hypothetical protein
MTQTQRRIRLPVDIINGPINFRKLIISISNLGFSQSKLILQMERDIILFSLLLLFVITSAQYSNVYMVGSNYVQPLVS